MNSSKLIGVKVRNLDNQVGFIVTISEDIIDVDFNGIIKKYEFPKSFGKFLFSENETFKEIVNNIAVKHKEESENKENTIKPIFSNYRIATPSSSDLLTSRAESISFINREEFWISLGYIASGKHVSSLTAEIPEGPKEDTFKRMFPNQYYSPIKFKSLANGLPTKFSCQFRITFMNRTNCPMTLLKNIKWHDKSNTGKINKSAFVLSLVRLYGFTFGTKQNIDKISAIAEANNQLDAFNKGLDL